MTMRWISEVLSDWLAERLALLRVAQGELERPLRDAYAAGGHVDTPHLEGVHHLREAPVQAVLLSAEHVLGGAAVAVEDELGGLDALVAELLDLGRDVQAGVRARVLARPGLFLGDKAGEAPVPGLGLGVGLDEHED